MNVNPITRLDYPDPDVIRVEDTSLSPRGKVAPQGRMRAELPQHPVYGRRAQGRPSSAASRHLPPQGEGILYENGENL